MSTPRFNPHKAGDTFSYAGTCQLPPGDWTATAQVRAVADNTLLGSIAVTLGTPGPGGTAMTLHADAADTAAWPAGLHQVDVRYADTSGTVLHTSTIVLPVVRPVTV
ncbi:MAG: hypothetical protein ACT4NV_02990 [Rhodoferax sp.]